MGAEHAKEVWKLRVRLMLLDACNTMGTFDGLVYKGKSRDLWTTKLFKKNAIKLVPYTPQLSVIDKDSYQDGTVMELNDDLIAVLRSRSVEPQADGSHFLVPFWQVRTTQDSAEANMTLTTQFATSKFADAREDTFALRLRIPVMTNTSQIAAGVQLLQFKKSSESAKRAAASGEANAPAAQRRRGRGPARAI